MPSWNVLCIEGCAYLIFIGLLFAIGAVFVVVDWWCGVGQRCYALASIALF